MKVIVCIKQVPDTVEVKIDPETNTLIREGVSSIINPFDMYAIEEAVKLKEKFGLETIVLTMGPPQAGSALREALSLGIDKAIHLCDRAFAGSDTWVTSFILAKAIEKINNFDLVICGKQASDGDTAQVGPGIAAHLNLPQATYVRRIDTVHFDTTPKVMVVERLLEEGYELLELSLPAVITVVKEINEPRLPSLRGKMKARGADIPLWTNRDLDMEEEKIGLSGSPTQVIKIFTPPHKEGGKVFQGDPVDTVDKLMEEIKDLIH
ncbi:MAG: electron transfer flavoprotein subunit beta/FixA family protein [Candidatus Omnitrophica bacterium]|nr:electron transfer flavoprotein subunit beta/FixA family protein [Candidatus Omnitrophota bacterium]MBU0897114.1 electron transfer flavoprotein subunit beta/FixA family protein [Candidatus Omnitrophota bacterium]MBU1133371.1 electron transfer flavoprotein subunit beta/FixA family protein [Candidatus Omnitrophota bacterium]MBU1367703.1 electron transfer flavoprotein subunit beta/FixA family protein [Candidatus Omnitrophota bacterium]MBU1523331.1 electron transfer flavoprotein subunit beta/FixA